MSSARCATTWRWRVERAAAGQSYASPGCPVAATSRHAGVRSDPLGLAPSACRRGSAGPCRWRAWGLRGERRIEAAAAGCRAVGPFLNDLPRRAFLTIKHHGWRELPGPNRDRTPSAVRRGAQGAGLASSCGRGSSERPGRWYRESGRPVTIVMPTYGDPSTTIDAVKRLRRTVDRSRTRILVVDDGSAREDQEKLLEIDGADGRACHGNRGYAASVNRGLALRGPGSRRGGPEQRCRGHGPGSRRSSRPPTRRRTGVVGPMLLYPDGRIQAAGAHRNLGAPLWFDHRYRFKRPDHGPARVPDEPSPSPAPACT